MKIKPKIKYTLLILATLLVNLATGQSNKLEKDTLNSNPNYEKALADSLGGDDYGMKSYFFVILKTGTNKTKDKELISESFRGHMDNINR